MIESSLSHRGRAHGKVEVYDADMLTTMQKEEADRWCAIEIAINALGEASATAQCLRSAITTTSKYVIFLDCESSNQGSVWTTGS